MLYSDIDKEGNTMEGSILYTTPNLLVEPQLMMRIGSENVKFSVKFGMAMLSDVSSESGKFMYDFFTGALGVTIAF